MKQNFVGFGKSWSVPFFLPILLLLVCDGVLAATRYVGVCGSPNNPTIAAAVAAASAGDTILVCPGTYNEAITVNKDNLTIRGSTGVRSDVTVSNSGIPFTLSATNPTLKDMTVTSSNNRAISRGWTGSASTATFSNLAVSAKDYGIYVEVSTKVTMTNLNVSSSNSNAIHLAWATNGAHEFDTVTASATNGRAIHSEQGGAIFRNLTLTSKDETLYASPASNAVFDTITATSSNNAGIYLAWTSPSSTLDFSNVTVTAKTYGIYINKSGKATFNNITVTSSNGSAVYLESGASGAHEFQSLVLNAKEYGLYAYRGGTTFKDLDITSSNSNGVLMYSDYDANFEDVKVSAVQGRGIHMGWASYNKKMTLQDVEITAKNEALYIEKSDIVTINGLTATSSNGDAVYFGYDAAGAHVLSSMTLNAKESGIKFESNVWSTSMSNICVDSGKYGVWINQWNSRNVSIQNSKFVASTYGIRTDANYSYKTVANGNCIMKSSTPRAYSNSTIHNFNGNYWQGVAGGTSYADGNVRDNATLGSCPVTSCYSGPLPLLTIATPAAVAEGNSGTQTMSFTASLSATTGSTVTAAYALSNGTATGGAACGAGVDYVNTGGTVTIASGSTTGNFSVTLCGDTTYEADETFTVTLSAPVNATLGTPSSATGTITNDDTAPTLTIAAAVVAEGNSGTTNLSFTVTQSAVSGLAGSASYTTSAGTATAGVSCTSGVDYITTSGTVTIAAGATTGTIVVPVCGDTDSEGNETFTVTLSSPANATLGSPSSATGTINDDDAVNVLAEYRFDECSWTSGAAGAVTDSSGSGYHGTPNSVNTATGGVVQRAADLSASGTADYIKWPVALLHGRNDFTAALWFKTSTSQAQQEILHGLGAGTGDDEIEIYLINTTQIRVNLFDAGNTYTAASSFVDGSWHHLVVTRAGTNVCVFLDATSLGCNTRGSGALSITNANALLTGQEQDAFGGSFADNQSLRAQLDEFKLFGSALSSTQIASIRANELAGNNWDGTARAAVSCGPHHLELQHTTGTGMTCAASTLTIKACADALTPTCTAFTAAAPITGTLTSTGVAVSWDGTTGGATGADFVIPAGSSTVTKSFQLAAAGTAVLGTTGISPTPTSATTCNFGSPSCTFTAGTAGFIFSDSATGGAYTIPNQIAGTATAANALYLRAVQASTTNAAVCTPAIISQTGVPVTLGYACNDPATCQLGNLLTFNSTGVPSTGGSVDLDFDANGAAPLTVRYDDVGQITLAASKTLTPFTGGTAITLTGSSNAFVVKPGGFVLSNIKCTTHGASTCAPALASPGTNPAAALASDAAFIQAGQNFSATVTATTSGGATTPNYGRETSPEGVKLTATRVLPSSGGASPTLNNSTAFGSFSNGVVTGTTFSWDEVGIITLTPSIGDGNYLGAGDVSGTVSGNVGRFIPDRFVLSAANITPANGGFTYLDQPFGIAYTLTAVNASGGTTTNYATANSFAKLDPTTPTLWPSTTLGSTGFGSGAKNGSTDLSTRLSLSGTPTGSWTSGEAAITANLKLGRPTTTTADTTWGPYAALDIGIAPQDSDGVKLATAALNLDADSSGSSERQKLSATATQQRFGRLRLINFYGSELLKPRVEYRAEYWDGTRWTINTLDSTSPIVAANMATGGLTVNGIAGLTNGIGFITFNTTGVGSYDIALNLGATGIANDHSCIATPPARPATTAANQPWLQGFWSGNCGSTPAWQQDPNARIKLGSSKAPYIYLRERY